MFRSPQVKWNLISSITNINYGLRNELQNDLLRFSQEIRKLKNLKNLTAPPPTAPAPPPTKNFSPPDKDPRRQDNCAPARCTPPRPEGPRLEFNSALDRIPERFHPTLISGPPQSTHLTTQVKL